jgi:uncharacterized membrane protein
VTDRLDRIEDRLSRIEARLGLAGETVGSPPRRPAALDREPAPSSVAADAFEVEVGQNWFAGVGILVLALGGGFMLTLPWASLPPALPTLAGLAAAAGLYLLARSWQRNFELVAGYLRGAALALMYCATLRLFLFGARPALDIASPAAPVLLLMAVSVMAAVAVRRSSPWLTALALACGCSSVIAVGSPWLVLVGLTALSIFAALISVQRRWPGVALAAIALVLVTYALWAIGNPARGGAFRAATAPAAAPEFLLLYAAAFAAAPLLRRNGEADNPSTIAVALATCALGYGLFLAHTAKAFRETFAAAHVLGSAIFVGLAVAYWIRWRSRVSTFFYAMTGYAALSMAIIKASASPEVFVWLSLQSLGVATTAIWFRSRLIVVANFLIYVAVVLAYMVLQSRETGISLGFGVVALLSARILNWQKHRLELQTELMRNAYLVCAFIVFPYALLHLVPTKLVGLAWIGIALVYYTLNLIVRNPKYRWMGHGTLLLTAAYLLLAGGRKLDPAWRVASFLLLGVTLLVVSLIFTRLQRRERAAGQPLEPES